MCSSDLADLPGVCSPAPGGPLDVAPGPVHGVVWQEDEGGRGLAQVLIGIGTAGMLIPGNKTATIYADLTAWTPKIPAPRSERVDWWKAHHDPIRFESLLGGPPLDREEAAALVALAGPDIVGSANAVMRRVRAEDRVAIVRVALGTRDDGRLELLAHLVVSLGEPTSGERLASVLALLPEDDQAAGRGLLTGEWRYLGDVLRAPEAERESALERVLTGPPAPGEAEAIVRAFEEPGPALTLLLPKVAPGDRLPLLTDVSERQSFDDQRLTLLDGREDLLAQADLAAIGRLVDTYTFDEGKRKAVDRILAVTPGPKRGPVLRLGVEKMSFDDARLELLDAWPAEAHALSKADKQAVLGAFVFKEEEARARLR